MARFEDDGIDEIDFERLPLPFLSVSLRRSPDEGKAERRAGEDVFLARGACEALEETGLGKMRELGTGEAAG